MHDVLAQKAVFSEGRLTPVHSPVVQTMPSAMVLATQTTTVSAVGQPSATI